MGEAHGRDNEKLRAGRDHEEAGTQPIPNLLGLLETLNINRPTLTNVITAKPNRKHIITSF